MGLFTQDPLQIGEAALFKSGRLPSLLTNSPMSFAKTFTTLSLAAYAAAVIPVPIDPSPNGAEKSVDSLECACAAQKLQDLSSLNNHPDVKRAKDTVKTEIEKTMKEIESDADVVGERLSYKTFYGWLYDNLDSFSSKATVDLPDPAFSESCMRESEVTEAIKKRNDYKS